MFMTKHSWIFMESVQEKESPRLKNLKSLHTIISNESPG